MIKVNGPRQVDSTSTRRVTRRDGSSASSSFHVEHTEPERAAGHASAAMPIGAVDSLLALQGVPEGTEGRRRAVKRAAQMLDLMDDIRLSLLAGDLPRGKLEGLLRVVQTGREDVADPHLSALLDEIELRAHVELAKYRPQL